MKTCDHIANPQMIPFIGIGSLGAMALNDLPPDIRRCVFTIFLARSGDHSTVSADFEIVYSYDHKNKHLDKKFLKSLQFLLQRNTSNIFLVANIDDDAASDCAIKTVKKLHEMGKMFAIHVNEPFDFQGKRAKDNASYALDILRKYTDNISVGNDGEILKECSHDIQFSDFLSQRSVVIFNKFRNIFSFFFN